MVSCSEPRMAQIVPVSSVQKLDVNGTSQKAPTAATSIANASQVAPDSEGNDALDAQRSTRARSRSVTVTLFTARVLGDRPECDGYGLGVATALIASPLRTCGSPSAIQVGIGVPIR